MGRTGLVLSIALLALTVFVLYWTMHPDTSLFIFVLAWLISSYGLYTDSAWGIPLQLLVVSVSVLLISWSVAMVGGVMLAGLLFLTVLAQLTLMTTVEV